MRRVVSLFAPRWAIDLIRRRHRQAAGVASPEGRGGERRVEPIVIVHVERGRQVVVWCCAAAEAAGVRVGMTLAHARALLPPRGLIVEPHRPERDHRALRALAEWATRFTPQVAADPPDGLLLDVTGCERLFHGERSLLQRLVREARRLGVHVRVACAPTFGCAWAIARYGREALAIVREGELRSALASLPVAGLRLDASTVNALREVGIERIGHLFDLPRGAVVDRFGEELLPRLDQALGEAVETIEPVRPRPPLSVRRVFDGPVKDGRGIALTVRGLIDELCGRLAHRTAGGGRLELRVERIDAATLHEAVTLSRPTRDAKHLWRLFSPRVERLHLGYGVEAMTLTATSVARLPHEQGESWPDDRWPAAARLHQASAELIDTLSSRLGAERVTRLEAVESHMPQGAFRSRPAIEGWRDPSKRLGRAAVTLADRPTLLLGQPEPIRVIAAGPDGVPPCLHWHGREHRIVEGFGPERLSAPWWRRHGRDEQRDYFKVADDAGRWLWIYRDAATGRWHLHGQWA